MCNPGKFLIGRHSPIGLLIILTAQQAGADFWSLRSKAQETVKLTRKLPPVAARSGNTVRFIPEIAGKSIPPETATILREKIRTLLLHAKAGGIQLVDGPADTTLKCIVTGYEPKVLHPGQRQIGPKHQQIVTWIGNIEASVQVLDRRQNPLDAANLKHHLENDFITAQQEEAVSSVSDKRVSKWDKVAGMLKTAKGGDAGDVASLAGGGKQMHDALAVQDKGGRQPTDAEWLAALIEGLAAKVANRIVPVDQDFIAILPIDKEFAPAREMAKNGRWGDVQETVEKMGSLKGGAEAFRLYLLGLSYEALAYQDVDSPNKAAELLNKATKEYDDSYKIKPNEREFLLAQIRAQDSLDHYLEIQHYLKNRPQQGPAPSVTNTAASKGPQEAASADSVGNAALIDMVNAGITESILLTYVRTAADPKFDISAAGLLQLARAKVPSTVIGAVQQRMSKAPVRRTPVKRAAPAVTPPPK